MEHEFTIDYPNGTMAINVYNYFAKANITQIKKFIRFCSQYCNDGDKENLLKMVEQAKNYWTEKFNIGKGNFTITSLHRYKGIGLLRSSEKNLIISLTPATHKQLNELLDKFEKAIKYIKSTDWSGV